jgi:uncharacterized protein YkwD
MFRTAHRPHVTCSAVTPGDRAPRAARPGRRRRSAPVVRRLAITAGLVGLAAVAAPTAPASAATTPTGVEQQFLDRVARARATHGLRPYRVGGAITRIARAQALRMADQDTLYHNPRLTAEVPNWSHVGENVGTGPDPVTIHRAFMRSPSHRANILSHEFTRVGVGAVERNGSVWVVEVFKTPSSV